MTRDEATERTSYWEDLHPPSDRDAATALAPRTSPQEQMREARRRERTERQQRESEVLRERELARGRPTAWEHLVRDDGL